jgi:hypothetical protein
MSSLVIFNFLMVFHCLLVAVSGFYLGSSFQGVGILEKGGKVGRASGSFLPIAVDVNVFANDGDIGNGSGDGGWCRRSRFGFELMGSRSDTGFNVLDPTLSAWAGSIGVVILLLNRLTVDLDKVTDVQVSQGGWWLVAEER